MPYYDDLRAYERTELGVRFYCYVKRGGWTETIAVTGNSSEIFDHSAFSSIGQERELRNHLRRQARYVLSQTDRDK